MFFTVKAKIFDVLSYYKHSQQPETNHSISSLLSTQRNNKFTLNMQLALHSSLMLFSQQYLTLFVQSSLEQDRPAPGAFTGACYSFLLRRRDTVQQTDIFDECKAEKK